MKFSLVAALLAAPFLAEANPLSRFGNDLLVYGVPTVENGGAWFHNEKNSAIFCWKKQPDEKATDFRVSLYRKGFSSNAALKDVKIDPLTPDEYKVIKKDAQLKFNVDRKVRQRLNVAVASATQTEPGDVSPPIDASQAQAKGTASSVAAMPAPENTGAPQAQEAATPYGPIVKRSIMTWSFVKNGGQLQEVPDELVNENKCYVATFYIKQSSSSSEYIFSLGEPKMFGIYHSDHKLKHVTLVAPPTTAEERRQGSFLYRSTEFVKGLFSKKNNEDQQESNRSAPQ